MVLSGDIPSDCNLASFRQARFFDFFNEIGHEVPFPAPDLGVCSRRRERPFAADQASQALGRVLSLHDRS
jgi:hypothetical protein